MCNSTVVKELPETSIWHGAISAEDAQLIRERHVEKVEEWLDFADFATELFKLHEKYGIDLGEEGYFAYRKHLRTNYDQKLRTSGPTPNPLDEGCDCIFCKMHLQETPTESEPAVEERSGSLGQVPAESPSDFDRCDDQEQASKKRGQQETRVPRSPAGNENQTARSKTRQSVTAKKMCMEADHEERANDESASRYDSVGGVEPDWEKNANSLKESIVPVYPLHPLPPRSPASALAQPPRKSDRRDNRKRREKRYGPDPVYVKTPGETAWLKRMSGTVF